MQAPSSGYSILFLTLSVGFFMLAIRQMRIRLEELARAVNKESERGGVHSQRLDFHVSRFERLEKELEGSISEVVNFAKEIDNSLKIAADGFNTRFDGVIQTAINEHDIRQELVTELRDEMKSAGGQLEMRIASLVEVLTDTRESHLRLAKDAFNEIELLKVVHIDQLLARICQLENFTRSIENALNFVEKDLGDKIKVLGTLAETKSDGLIFTLEEANSISSRLSSMEIRQDRIVAVQCAHDERLNSLEDQDESGDEEVEYQPPRLMAYSGCTLSPESREKLRADLIGVMAGTKNVMELGPRIGVLQLIDGEWKELKKAL